MQSNSSPQLDRNAPRCRYTFQVASSNYEFLVHLSRQEFILLSDVLGVSALVDAINNPSVGNATESSVLGPFFTEDAADGAWFLIHLAAFANVASVPLGESIASEGKGEYMYVEGRVLDIQGRPIAGATIETWETDENGFYDTQYTARDGPDCRGRLKTDANGKYQYRAVVPVAYPIPGDASVQSWVMTQFLTWAFRDRLDRCWRTSSDITIVLDICTLWSWYVILH